MFMTKVRGFGLAASSGVVAVALAGCGGGGTSLPAASQFTASAPCRQGAPELLSIAHTAQHSSSAQALATALTGPQKKLMALRGDPAIAQVVTAVGFLRIGAVSHTYQDQMRTSVRSAVTAAIDSCTGKAGHA